MGAPILVFLSTSIFSTEEQVSLTIRLTFSNHYQTFIILKKYILREGFESCFLFVNHKYCNNHTD